MLSSYLALPDFHCRKDVVLTGQLIYGILRAICSCLHSPTSPFFKRYRSLTCDDFSVFLPLPFGCRVPSNRARRRMLCGISLILEAVKALPTPYNATLGQVRVLWDTGASGSNAWAAPQTGSSPGEQRSFSLLHFCTY